MSISTIRRQMKNVACNYSDAQVKVREATSNDPWGPSTVMMSEIADLTHNPVALNDIMVMLFKRLNDHGKNWRHVYKSLILLDYIIKCGSERIAQQCKENIYTIETLKDFQHVEDNRDQGLNVREKAKQMVLLLKDDEKLKSERQKFQSTRRRFIQPGVGNGAGSSSGRVSELEDARPTSLGEEEMQLQIALALSKEESKKEEDIRKGYHARLQQAMEESKTNEPSLLTTIPTENVINETPKPTNNVIDDLLSLDFGTIAIQPTTNDPWGGGNEKIQNNGLSNIDPWNSGSVNNTQVDLFSNLVVKSEISNDPWGIDNQSTTNILNNPNISSSQNGYTGPLENNLNDQKKGVLNPENFLGPNSNLVNLDNLMGSSSSTALKTMNNPFLPVSQQPTNPFLAQQGPTPTLNDMMHAQRSQGSQINNQASTNAFSLF
uniref:ENTH domain-containing protein n=1 Tax=Parastrongyloides trichosuri TaxID=131310 RepID=A0A0N5A6B0_PARTI